MAINISFVILCELFILIVTSNGDSKNMRVFNGVKTENPHLVQIDITDPSDVVSCSGVIVNDRWILTAAHCVDSHFIIDITVRYNNDYVFKKDVSQFVKHPNYKDYNRDGYNAKHDIALLKTSEPMNFNGLIKPIKLAREPPVPGQTATVVGFGLPNLQPEEGGVVVAYCNGTTLCTPSLRGLAKPGEGDSGGPLILNGKLIGIDSSAGELTSYGRIGEKVTYLMDFYADIPSNLNWIESVIRN